jgi:hypothetical protein
LASLSTASLSGAHRASPESSTALSRNTRGRVSRRRTRVAATAALHSGSDTRLLHSDAIGEVHAGTGQMLWTASRAKLSQDREARQFVKEELSREQDSDTGPRTFDAAQRT